MRYTYMPLSVRRAMWAEARTDVDHNALRDKVAEAYQDSLDAASYYRTTCYWSAVHGFHGFFSY